MAPDSLIGTYCDTLTGLFCGTESGTSDLLSIRYVILARSSDDLQTIVPSVAKPFSWNDNFTELCEGHKWFDGAPFTAEDVACWYNDVLMDHKVIEKAPGRWLFDNKQATDEAADQTTLKFPFPVAQPNLLNRWGH